MLCNREIALLEQVEWRATQMVERQPNLEKWRLGMGCLTTVDKCLMAECNKERARLFFVMRVTGQEAMGSNWNATLSEGKEKTFFGMRVDNH